MKLWLLDLKEPVRYQDEGEKYFISPHSGAESIVIRAPSAAAARQMAADREKAAWWLDDQWTSCIEINPDGEAGIILIREYGM